MIVTSSPVNSYGKYILHKSVCDHNLLLIRHLLDNKVELHIDIDERDERGVTPLLYSIHFGFYDIFKMLLDAGADPGRKSGQGWNPLQETISRQERHLAIDLLTFINKKIDREYEKRLQTLVGHLQNIPDFYMELKWEVHSWVPLVSRLCPNDCYKIWKRGADFRLDATLLADNKKKYRKITGMDKLQWKRGNMSFVFLGSDTKEPRSPNSHEYQVTQGDIFLIDRDKQTFENVYTTNPLLRIPPEAQDMSSVDRFMNMKEVSNANLVVDNVEFSTVKTWFGYEKKEQVGGGDGFEGWNAKVYSMDNLDLITKHRKVSRENSNPSIPPLVKTSSNPSSSSVLTQENIEGNFAAMESGCSSNDSGSETPAPTMYETFDNLIPKADTISTKKKKLKGTVWISEDYPRKVSQILPVFEVLAPTWKHFAKINSFLTMRMPSGEGFPVKLDFPIVPTVSAVVTFGKHVEGPIDKDLFEIPENYKQVFHTEKRRRGSAKPKGESSEKTRESEDLPKEEKDDAEEYETGEESSDEQFFDLEENGGDTAQ
eukprot:TRINITY_DN50_c0_g1_i10.p1 TRINITY_DN50_c0_g1~~TRINITY_DN50_c0_g1_i10.p1  ORF type:complete len:542 (-),score=119.50 TRINITY_DN50_c0_g1_i10:229-1854(-)